MDEDKLTDIIAILMKEERTDLVEYVKKMIEVCDFDYEFSDEDSSSESEGEYEDITINVDKQGFHSIR